MASVTRERRIRAKERQLLSDEPSARKCKAKDAVFEALGYNSMRSRYAARFEMQLQAKGEDIQE